MMDKRTRARRSGRGMMNGHEFQGMMFGLQEAMKEAQRSTRIVKGAMMKMMKSRDKMMNRMKD